MYIGNENFEDLGRRKKRRKKKKVASAKAIRARELRKKKELEFKRRRDAAIVRRKGFILPTLTPIPETIEPAYTPEAMEPAYVPEAMEPGYTPEAIEPAYTPEAIEDQAVTQEDIIDETEMNSVEGLGNIMEFPSVEKAIAYIKSKVGDLFKQSYVLTKQMERIQKLKQAAKAKGNDTAYAKLIALETQVQDSQKRQKDLESKVTKMGKYAGLSALPLILIALAIPTAILLALHYKKISAQAKSLDLIERGLLTPAEAQALMPSGIMAGITDMFTSIKWPLFIGGGLIAGYVLLGDKKKERR